MHSTLVRAQNVFGFFTSVAFAVAAAVAFSVVFFPQQPSATVSLRNIQIVKGRPHYYSTKKEEYAHIKFDLEADFTSLFTWNTKQLFVYVQAIYPSTAPNAPPSQAIIWDTIINSPAQANPPDPWALIGGNPFAKAPAKSKGKSKAKGKKVEQEVNQKPGLISLKNVKPKYQITDISGRLAERGNATLEVGWNVQPWVGALTWASFPPTSSSSSSFPVAVNDYSERYGGGVLGSFMGFLTQRWEGVRGGRSEVFDFPALKGSAKKEEKVVGKGEVPRPGAAEAVL